MKYILYTVIGFGLGITLSAWAQNVSTPPIMALACAFNTIPPTPVSGQFYLVQCDSTGALITSK